MSEIYYALIILPIIIIAVLSFAFQSSVTEISRQQLILNCPYPINSGIGNLTAIQNPPQVNYTITRDTNGGDYHVTIFKCGETSPTSVSTSLYTAVADWFAFTDRVSGYMFYISQSISSFFEKVSAGGTLIYLMVFAPSEATGLAWFGYVNAVMLTFIALGVFLVVRG